MEITITISTLTITGQDIMIPLMFVIYVGVMIWLFKHKKTAPFGAAWSSVEFSRRRSALMSASRGVHIEELLTFDNGGDLCGRGLY